MKASRPRCYLKPALGGRWSSQSFLRRARSRSQCESDMEERRFISVVWA